MVKFLSILCLILILFFSGCFSKPTGTLAQCEVLATEQRDLCYFDSGVQENKLSYCTQISGDVLRNNCINSVS
ncbi:MAG: hypothetical protein COV47_01470 [Candidatus Diapherotrites archaeon CG11_big_fil_rev_8_21_14_0_20_37_9]|nr:MAG: hypothetical protein COV47_01470 [Candidatus Diapherotrites archaeon CG11_big_fil_rev_8_21_14_0_20_37_9]